MGQHADHATHVVVRATASPLTMSTAAQIEDPAAASPADVPAGGEFRRPVLRGLAWQSATRGTFEVSKLLVAMALARLLTPHQYGVAGMVIVVLSFEPVLSGTGLASALVQRPVITEEDKSTVFWTNAGLGLLVSLTACALSGPVAYFYHDPEVRPLFAAASVVFLLSSLSSVQIQLLVREMDFRSLELRSMAGIVVGAVAAIGVAVIGGGPWALVVQPLGFFGVSLILLWRFSSWRPKLLYSRKSLRELRGFAGNVSGTMMMFQLTQNADNVLIGRFLGATQLGFYSLGYNIILVPVTRISAPLILVLYPVFSRVQHDLKRLSSLWLRVLRLTSALAVPATFGLIVVAPDLVNVVFGHRWHAATPVVEILAAVGLMYGLQGLNGAVLQATNNANVLFRYSCVSFVLCLISFVIGLHWGIVGVAACFAGVSAFIQPVYMSITARAVGTGLRQCAQALSGVIQAALVAMLAEALARQFLLAHDVPAGARLLVVIAVGVVVYTPLCAWRAPEVTWELRQILARRVAKGTTEMA